MLEDIPTFSPYASMCIEAPLKILVCGDTTQEKVSGYWLQDCSAATQNLLLAANALGLGAVCTEIYPIKNRIEGVRKAFELPDNLIPPALVPIGYPAQKPEPQDRYREEKVYHNRYGQKRIKL